MSWLRRSQDDLLGEKGEGNRGEGERGGGRDEMPLGNPSVSPPSPELSTASPRSHAKELSPRCDPRHLALQYIHIYFVSAFC